MDITEYQYKTSFACKLSTSLLNKEEWMAKASIDNLKKIVPAFALENTFDLLPIAFNSCVVNLVNLNDDVIDTDTGLAVYQKFEHRPINLEHDRSRCVGHIIGAALSSFSLDYKEGFGSEIIEPDQVRGSNDPFNICLSGFIYKVVDADLIDLIVESSNPLGENYLKISASWELAFNEFDILVGSPLISKGTRISDPEEKAKYIPHLRAYGGSGKYKDQQPVYRLIKGNAIPIGIGLTATPAGAVQGIVALASAEESTQVEEPKAELEPEVPEISAEVVAEVVENSEETQNNFSQTNLTPVKIVSIMRLEDITDENLTSFSAANLREFIAQEIDKASSEYAVKLDEAKNKAESSETEATTVKSQLELVSEELRQLKEQLDAEKEARATEKAQADFDGRMADLNEQFNLTDQDLAIIAKQIRGLDDSAFAGWLTDWNVIAEQKNKAFKPATEQAAASVASVEAALENATPKADQPSIPNAQATTTDKKAVWAEAFKLEDLISK